MQMIREIRKAWRRVYFLLNRSRLERELAEEMEIHRDMMPPDSRSQFGSDARLREESGDAWPWTWLDQLSQDLSYGAKVLLNAPAFTLGAMSVLALGVGVNLAEFQVFDAMIFHRLSIRNADSVLHFSLASRQGARLGFPSGAVDVYRTGNHSYAWLVSEDATLDVVLEGDANLRANLVSPNYFGDLGIVPAWGRLPDARDAQPGAPAVVALGYEYWRTRWAADPHVVGRIVHVNNIPVRIVGVLPSNFNGLWSGRIPVWFPVSIGPLLVPGSPPPVHEFSRASSLLFGMLREGVSPAAGEAELTSLTRELNRRQPGYFRSDARVQSRPLQESRSAGATRSPAIAIFIVMVLLVLLSACANLGNMLLARGLARQREIDIRLAIGASRARIVRQLMTENLLLAMLGTAAGVAFGAGAARLLLAAMDAPPDIRVTMNWPVLVTGLVLTILSAVAFGLPSALQTVRPGHRKVRQRQSLVAVQVAVSCLLLILSGVLTHKGILSASIDLAFDYTNMIVVYPQERAASSALQRLDALSTRFSALPGVDGVTAAVAPPLGGKAIVDSRPGLPPVYRNAVAPSYFTVMSLPVRRGRTFLAGERNSVILSESGARAVWPNQDPLGRIWKLGGTGRTVVGVVKDSGANLLGQADSIEAYIPMEGADAEHCALILHTRGDAAALVRMIPGAAAVMGETVSVSLMRTGRDRFLDAQRRMVTLIGSIGAVATTLASAGMFALIAFAVARRKRELGIRIAIGARPRHILRVLLTENIRPTAAGVVAGALLALVVSRLVRSLVIMPNRDTLDLTGFAGGIACFLVVAALATLSPALRALRIDPSATLREE
jgi:predicted permease